MALKPEQENAAPELTFDFEELEPRIAPSLMPSCATPGCATPGCKIPDQTLPPSN